MKHRTRRLAGWGFEDESFEPSAEMLSWLEDRLGPATPLPPPADPLSVPADPAQALPRLPGDVSESPEDRLRHSRGQGLPDLLYLRSGRVPALPDAVARPAGEAEIEGILRAASEAEVAVIPRGGGTSVTGGVHVEPGGPPTVVVSLERLAGLEGLDPVSGLATFGAGATGPEVEAALAPEGFTLGHFPQSWELSTVGGWVAARASGQESLGYGRIEDLTAGLTLLAPAGRLELPPQPAAAAGPELREVVLGSEGRYGVISRVTLRVRPTPVDTTVEGWLLPSWDRGLVASRELVQQGVPLTLLRLSNEPETEVALAVGLGGHSLLAPVARAWWRLRGVRRGCLLLLAVAGSVRERERSRDEALDVLSRHGAVGLGTRPGRTWQRDRFRHPYLRDALLDRGLATDTLETAAPWSQLSDLAATTIRAIEESLEDPGERVACLCHVSHPYRDGASLYFTFFYRCPEDPDAAVDRWWRIKRAATDALVDGGGVLSHHHGIGRWHAPWMKRALGASAIEAIEGVARTLDPRGVMNPGVLTPP